MLLKEVDPGSALSSVPGGGIPVWSLSLVRIFLLLELFSGRQIPATGPYVAAPEIDINSHCIPSGSGSRGRLGSLDNDGTGVEGALGRTSFFD